MPHAAEKTLENSEECMEIAVTVSREKQSV
jgi:hypothetical protein